MTRGVTDSRVDRVRQTAQHSPRKRAFIDQRTRERLIPVNTNGLAGLDDPAVALERVADIDLPFLHADDGRLIVFFYTYFERGAANRDHRGRSVNPIWIRLIAPMLDVDPYAAHQHVQ